MINNKPMYIKPKFSRLTLGALTVEGHIYNQRIWSGIVEVAKEQGVNLIGFNGLPMQAPSQYTTQANIIYDLVNDAVFDGLLINSSSVFNYITRDESVTFLHRYGASLPMVSIGIALPGIPSIIIDNYNGFYELIVHLIEVHGRRRIAFIKAPEHSVEGQTRYQAYVDALAHHHLAVDADLVAPGEFYFRSGMKGIELLVDQRQVQFDAIVAASDDSALGAIEGLRVRGIHVPRDVSVIGFDDNPKSKYAVPPLTSVHQPIEELGRLAATNLLKQLSGEKLPLITQIPTTPVIRQSCGCLSPQVERVWVENPFSNDLEVKPAYEAIPRLAIVQVMAKSLLVDGQDPFMLASQVFDAFLAALTKDTPELFLAEWSHLLRQALFANQDMFCWQEILSVMRRELLPFVGRTNASYQAENLWHQARVLMVEVLQQSNMQQGIQERRNARLLQEINDSLLMTFDMAELLNLLAKLLPRLGIKSYYLNLYEKLFLNELIIQIPEWSRLILAYDENGRFPVPVGGQQFLSTQLIPADFLVTNSRRDMLVMPLFVQDTQLGFGLFEMDYPDAQLFNLLRNQLSSAIYGALLFQQGWQTQVELEKRVEERTQELELRNAELERFTYTVSHDLKSPLITIQGFLGFLEKDALSGDLQRMKEDIVRISDATSRMRVLLDDLLELSRVGRLVNPPELVSLTKLTEEAILLVSGQIDARGVQVVVPSDLPEVYGDYHRLVEVMQNLLDNAVKFMGQQPEPRIEVGADIMEDEVLCYVRDNGVGISPQYHETVFGLFDRLDSSIEGTGIGLALVRRIIEIHDGRIWVKSEGAGLGSTFYFTLPNSSSQLTQG